MICINNINTDSYFNLAAEEYLLKNFTSDIFMLWRNEPSIIVGKYQNTLAEINYEYVKENNIKVVRRLSGGGAVFHDLGNINFTVIKNGASGGFQSFTAPILDVLQKLGVPAKFEGRNDLTIDGKKISGNAQCIHNGRTLHHGTLLFASQMSNLAAALRVNPLKFEDKAVKSVRKRVTNISEYLSQPLTVVEFGNMIMQHIMSARNDCEQYNFNDFDIAQIQNLRDKKYATWNWNFGESPNYAFNKIVRTKAGNIEAHLNIANGKITAAKIYGDFFARKDLAELENALVQKKHERKEIEKILEKMNIDDYICGANADDILNLLF